MKKKVLVFALCLGLTVGMLAMTGCSKVIESEVTGNEPAGTVQGEDTQKQETTTNKTNAKVTIKNIKTGSGKAVKTGDKVSIVYKGTLKDGTVFDQNSKGNPLKFTLGSGDVIEGFDQGVTGMKKGGTRKVTIPPELGYGDQQMGNIPAGSTLIFTITLL